MKIVTLTCPSWAGDLPPALSDVPAHAVAERPGKDDVDALTSESTRIVVAGTDADLAAVALRLLRKERLAQVELAYLPTSPDSAVADVWGLPTNPDAAATLAVRGDPDAVPLVRDDNGGVLLGRGELRPLRGVVYCDDDLVLRGGARRLEVTPLAPVGVDVRVVRPGLLGSRVRASSGRAVQIGCLATLVVSDGVPHPRPVTRWTWYKHTEPLRLVRGLH
ncbi:hypothetical protein [Pseudonocardia spinosispora]|uniref:hypothetical protein n=1 Tax=Pseudonocardia spinosispora TaxID=103441 RepID=UPI0003FAB305|nr:hypothetical protein [Pseudonocardia spinosispora]